MPNLCLDPWTVFFLPTVNGYVIILQPPASVQGTFHLPSGHKGYIRYFPGAVSKHHDQDNV